MRWASPCWRSCGAKRKVVPQRGLENGVKLSDDQIPPAGLNRGGHITRDNPQLPLRPGAFPLLTRSADMVRDGLRVADQRAADERYLHSLEAADLQEGDRAETRASRLRDKIAAMKAKLKGHPDQPEWLDHVNASVLKIKLALAIIGISSIHLLRTFIEAGNLGRPDSTYTEAGIMWQTIIHTIFILSAIGIAIVDRLQVHDGPRTAPDHGHS